MLKILIAEDHKTSAETLALALERLGHQVIVGTGADVILTMSDLEKKTTDVLIADYDLRDQLGCVLLRILNRANPNVKSILMTGHGDISLCGREEFDVVIRKPLDLQQLETQLKQWEDSLLQKKAS